MKISLLLLLSLSTVIFLTGCTSAISTTQSAETLKPGQFQVSAATNVAIPASRVIDAYDKAKTLGKKLLADSNYQPTEQEKQDYLSAAIGLALSAPGIAPDFMARYGVADNVDVGLRYSTTGLHGDVKLQFLDAAGWHGAVSLGFQHHIYSGIIFDLLEYIDVKDFSRNDIELPVLFGRSFGYRGLRRSAGDANVSGVKMSGRIWFGPKYILSRTKIDAKLTNIDASLQTSENFSYLGGTLGGAVGISGLEAFVEVTTMYLDAKATILDQRRQLGGIVVMPTIGVQAAF
jgi:hypothetical protein